MGLPKKLLFISQPPPQRVQSNSGDIISWPTERVRRDRLERTENGIKYVKEPSQALGGTLSLTQMVCLWAKYLCL